MTKTGTEKKMRCIVCDGEYDTGTVLKVWTELKGVKQSVVAELGVCDNCTQMGYTFNMDARRYLNPMLIPMREKA